MTRWSDLVLKHMTILGLPAAVAQLLSERPSHVENKLRQAAIRPVALTSARQSADVVFVSGGKHNDESAYGTATALDKIDCRKGDNEARLTDSCPCLPSRWSLRAAGMHRASPRCHSPCHLIAKVR